MAKLKKSARIYARLSRAMFNALLREAGHDEDYAPIVRKALGLHLKQLGYDLTANASSRKRLSSSETGSIDFGA